MKIYKLKESCYNIATCSDSTFLIKNNDDFYKIDKKVFKEIININDLIFIREIKDNIFITVLMICTIIFTVYVYFSSAAFTIMDMNFLYANLILLGNIPLHEFGHIIFLKIFNKNSKCKIGFKFVFILLFMLILPIAIFCQNINE